MLMQTCKRTDTYLWPKKSPLLSDATVMLPCLQVCVCVWLFPSFDRVRNATGSHSKQVAAFPHISGS